MDSNIMDQLAQALPGRWGVYAPLVFLTLSGLCNILAIGLEPPTWGSKNYALRKIYYLVVTWGALNLGHAANRLQCERTGLMVKREDVDRAVQVLSQNGISVLNKVKPPT